MILVDLIEEDFTNRAFDNIKALHGLVKELQSLSNEGGQAFKNEEEFVVAHLDAFFKYRNKV